REALVVRKANVIELDLAESEIDGFVRGIGRVFPDRPLMGVEPGAALFIAPRLTRIGFRTNRPLWSRLSQQRVLGDHDSRDGIDAVRAHRVQYRPHPGR